MGHSLSVNLYMESFEQLQRVFCKYKIQVFQQLWSTLCQRLVHPKDHWTLRNNLLRHTRLNARSVIWVMWERPVDPLVKGSRNRVKQLWVNIVQVSNINQVWSPVKSSTQERGITTIKSRKLCKSRKSSLYWTEMGDLSFPIYTGNFCSTFVVSVLTWLTNDHQQDQDIDKV